MKQIIAAVFFDTIGNIIFFQDIHPINFQKYVYGVKYINFDFLQN